jgi:multiple sugar transport system permease protein
MSEPVAASRAEVTEPTGRSVALSFGARWHRRAWASYVVMGLLAIFFVVPLLFMLVSSIKPNSKVLEESDSLRAFLPTAFENNYARALGMSGFGRLFVNSVIITGSVVVVGTVVNSMAGFALARVRFRGQRILLAFVVALFIVPFQAVALPLLLMMSNVGLTNTLVVQILPFIASPFFIYLFYSFFLELPRELDEAARIDGAGAIRVFRSIALPLAGPMLATSAILNFVFVWGDLFWALMVTHDPAVRPVALGLSVAQDTHPIPWGDVMAMATAIAAPALVAFVIFQRAFVRSIARSGIRG